MARTGTKRNPKLDPRIEKSVKEYQRVMHLENLVEQFGDAMRSAEESYIAHSGFMTPRMTAIWDQYVDWARSR